MRKPRPFFFTMAFTALVVLGFGCKKPATDKPKLGYGFWQIDKPVKPPTVAPTPDVRKRKPNDKGDHYVEPEVRYLQQVLNNFTNVRSFRASLKLPSSAIAPDGEMEFARGKGLHGSLRLPDGTSSELVFIKQDIFFRSGTSTEWTNLGGTDEGARMTRSFVLALNLSPSGTADLISDKAKMLSREDDPSGCKRYTFIQRDMTGEKQTSYLCVQNELPTIVGTVTPQGNVETRYRDFNQPIEIKNPIKKEGGK